MVDPRMEKEPDLMLPANLPEDIFDLIFIQSHTLLNAIGSDHVSTLDVDIITNIVSDILRIYDIYDIYKDNLASLVVMYASWVILESLDREGRIRLQKCTFETLFDNDLLMQALQEHHKAFENTIKDIIIDASDDA